MNHFVNFLVFIAFISFAQANDVTLRLVVNHEFGTNLEGTITGTLIGKTTKQDFTFDNKSFSKHERLIFSTFFPENIENISITFDGFKEQISFRKIAMIFGTTQELSLFSARNNNHELGKPIIFDKELGCFSNKLK